MDIFIRFKSITEPDIIKLVRKFIKYQTNKFVVGCDVEYVLYTYTLKLPRNTFEDDIYAKYPELLTILPRACSILTTADNEIISSLEGPMKFSGRTDIDEDPDDCQDESNVNTIYDHSKIVKYATDKELEIVETEKANGKFAICKMIKHNSKELILCGSKNFHIVFDIDSIDEIIKENMKQNNEIILNILIDIKKNIEKINSDEVFNVFNQGYSLVGELCDGQHFTEGDNTISWFGFFQDGKAMETIEALNFLKKNQLKTVDYELVFTPKSSIEELENVFLNARCKNTEGSVLRCRNVKTNDTIFVKTKSVIYIVKRFMRQILIRGYKEIESIYKRFIQAQKYHGLNTTASIRITNQLIKFAFWMMSKYYPGSILGHLPIESVKGHLKSGFNTYWKEFITETKKPEIIVSLTDFGIFDESIYLKNVELYHKRSYADPAIVVFIQGIQGSGKSTIANWICQNFTEYQTQYIEQDMFWGDTLACQGSLYHMIQNVSGPKVIIVSRCNVNEIQYKRYLEIVSKLPCIVSFISPQDIDMLYLMISLSGIINRSKSGDNLMVGRFEMPIEKIVEFTVQNFKCFEPASKINTFQTHYTDTELSVINESGKSMDNQQIINFVSKNYQKLNELRLPLEVIGKQIINIIKKTIDGDNPEIVMPKNPMYIGMAVSDNDKEKLSDFVNQFIPDEGYTQYLHHCTQFFTGKSKMSDDMMSKFVKPGQVVFAEIDALIIRKSDNASAFRIKELSIGPLIHQAHITAKIPSNEKPMCSNGFIGLTDSSVKIIDFSYKLKLTGFWN